MVLSTAGFSDNVPSKSVWYPVLSLVEWHPMAESENLRPIMLNVVCMTRSKGECCGIYMIVI